MSYRWPYLVGALAVAGAAVYGLLLGPTPEGDKRGPVAAAPAAVATPAAGPFLGGSSCGGAACHSGPPPAAREDGTPDADWTNAATVWLQHDAHGRAYEALRSERSQRIMDLLPDKTGKKAWEDATCLACHATPALAGKADARSVELRREGVGCEACHGPAKEWLTAHQTWKDPAEHRNNYEKSGMTWLNDTADRAALCAGCHVGAPEVEAKGLPPRDVNHDLIAAGHPRLSFEYASYVRRMPRHWAEKNRTDPAAKRPDTPVFDDWWAGQRASAAAALALLDDRCRRAAPGVKQHPAPWPEFAEQTCFACHSDLEERGGGRAPRKGQDLGLPPWTSWTGSKPFRSVAGDKELSDRWAVLGKAINAFEPHDVVRPKVGKAREALDKVGPLPPPAEASRKALFALLKDGDFRDWDDAAQAYHALTGRRGADAEASRKLQPLLRFGPGKYGPPKGYDPKRVQELLGQLLPP